MLITFISFISFSDQNQKIPESDQKSGKDTGIASKKSPELFTFEINDTRINGRDEPWRKSTESNSWLNPIGSARAKYGEKEKRRVTEKKKKVDDMPLLSFGDSSSELITPDLNCSETPQSNSLSKFKNLSPRKLRLRNQRLRNFFILKSRSSDNETKQNESILRNTTRRSIERGILYKRKIVRWKSGNDLEEISFFDNSERGLLFSSH